jgi:hypothetical protein
MYQIVRVFKDGSPKRVVMENLTRGQANLEIEALPSNDQWTVEIESMGNETYQDLEQPMSEKIQENQPKPLMPKEQVVTLSEHFVKRMENNGIKRGSKQWEEAEFYFFLGVAYHESLVLEHEVPVFTLMLMSGRSVSEEYLKQ